MNRRIRFVFDSSETYRYTTFIFWKCKLRFYQSDVFLLWIIEYYDGRKTRKLESKYVLSPEYIETWSDVLPIRKLHNWLYSHKTDFSIWFNIATIIKIPWDNSSDTLLQENSNRKTNQSRCYSGLTAMNIKHKWIDQKSFVEPFVYAIWKCILTNHM